MYGPEKHWTQASTPLYINLIYWAKRKIFSFETFYANFQKFYWVWQAWDESVVLMVFATTLLYQQKIQKLFQAQNNKTTCFLYPLSIIWWCSTRRAVFSNLHCNKMWPYFLHQDPNEFNLFHFSWIYFIWSKENEKTLWAKLSQDKKHFSN